MSLWKFTNTNQDPQDTTTRRAGTFSGALARMFQRTGTMSTRLAVTLALGELGWDTTLRRLFMGDGSTPGGVPIGPGHFSVKAFGAKGDFVDQNNPGTDDSAAIQAAVTACCDAGGGTVYADRGLYRVDTQIQIVDSDGEPGKYVLIKGDGCSAGFGSNGGTALLTDKGITVFKWPKSTTSNKGRPWAPAFEDITIKDYGKRMLIGAVSGSGFVAGEVVTGGTSAGTATVNANSTGDVVYLTPLTGTLVSGEVLTGGTSTETATTTTAVRDGGIMAGGIHIEMANFFAVRNVQIIGSRTGYGLFLDASYGDWVQMGDLTNLNITNCKYGVKTDGKVSDITVHGGTWKGSDANGSAASAPPDANGRLIDDSIGFYFQNTNSASGRIQFFGTVITDYETGIEVNNGRNWQIFGITCEQQSAAHGWGTGLKFTSDGNSDYGHGNRLFGGHFIGQAVGIDVGTDCERTFLCGPAFQSCTTKLLDNGEGTTIIAPDTGADFLGMMHGYRRANGTGQQAGFLPREMVGSDVQPTIRIPSARGLNIADGDYDGGVFLGAEDTNDVTIGGGLHGDPQTPKFSTTDASAIWFHEDDMFFMSGTGATPGDSFVRTVQSFWALRGADKSLQFLNGTIQLSKVLSGTGSPETVVTAEPGSLFLRTDGGGGAAVVYLKASGSAATGWETMSSSSATDLLSGKTINDAILIGSITGIGADEASMPETTFGGHILDSNGNHNIGATAAPFAKLYITDIDISGDILPTGSGSSLGGITDEFSEVYANKFFPGTGGANTFITSGTGSPEGVVSAEPGSLYLNVSGGTGTTLWVKESGTGTTLWVAK